MKYTARLTGNKRGIKTTTPKALLINIDPDSDLDRDHCWVDITPELAKIMPKGHQKPIAIEFEADLKQYMKRAITTSYTLTNIRNIRRVK